MPLLGNAFGRMIFNYYTHFLNFHLSFINQGIIKQIKQDNIRPESTFIIAINFINDKQIKSKHKTWNQNVWIFDSLINV